MGAVFALACALTWSVAVILFKRCGGALHPLHLNALKNVFAAVLLGATVLALGEPWPASLNVHDLALTTVSGVLGVGLADAMILYALGRIDATVMAIIDCAYSPIVVALAFTLLGETLSPTRTAGAALVVAAVGLIAVRGAGGGRQSSRSAVLVALLGIVAIALGIVLVKPVLGRQPLLWVVFLRVVAGSVASLIVLWRVPAAQRRLARLADVREPWLLALGCFLGTYVSMILWIAGFKYADATVTAVLNQTSTVFTVLLAAIVLGERVTRREIAATGIAFVGVMLITLS
jgi:drug/metabolite transporter (DMT)-like permease